VGLTPIQENPRPRNFPRGAAVVLNPRSTAISARNSTRRPGTRKRLVIDMRVPPPIRRALPLTAIAASVAVVVVIAVLAGRSHLAQHVRESLDGASESELPLRIEQLVELGEPGVTALTDALNSDKTEVAQAAEAALLDQLDHWQTQDGDRASRKITHLVRELAKRSPQYNPRAQAAAGDLAMQALDWRPAESDVDRTRLIIDCAILLRAAANDGNVTQPGESSILGTVRPSLAAPPEPNDGSTTFFGHAATPLEPVESPGESGSPPPLNHGQPPKVARSPLPSPDSPPPRVLAPSDTAPKATPESNEEENAETPECPPAPLNPPLTRPVPWDPRRAKPTTSGNLRLLSANQEDSIAELRTQDDLSLMRQLHSSISEDVEAARLELRRRGFDARHLRMAEDLTNLDPDVRMRFAQTLPAIRDVDIRPWLRVLTEDDDPQVRRSAIAVIATFGTAESRSWLRRLQLAEHDPQVQRHLDKILGRP